MGRPNQFGIRPDHLKRKVYEIVAEYPAQLTVRTVHYELVMARDFNFPNTIKAYKFLSRWLRRWRAEDRDLNEKFVDLTRLPIIPPKALGNAEVWFEKASTFLGVKDIIERYRLPVQIERGYGSFGMFTQAIRRARERGIEIIIYYGDVGPSPYDIERVTKRMMAGVRVVRIALTPNQVKQFKLPPRPAKESDRRTPRYLRLYGPETFEIEGMRPQILREVTEQALRKFVPVKFVQEAELREAAAKLVAEFLRPLRERIEGMTYELLQKQLSIEEIKQRLSRRFKL